jgi:hypothetical protein
MSPATPLAALVRGQPRLPSYSLPSLAALAHAAYGGVLQASHQAAAERSTGPMCTGMRQQAAAPGRSSHSSHSSHSSKMAGQLSDDCGICLDRRCAVVLSSCQHALCLSCAQALVSMSQQQRAGTRTGADQVHRPLPCPFCRQPVAGFSHIATASQE